MSLRICKDAANGPLSRAHVRPETRRTRSNPGHYEVESCLARTALFRTRSDARLLRPGMAELDSHAPCDSRLQHALAEVERIVERKTHDLKLAS